MLAAEFEAMVHRHVRANAVAPEAIFDAALHIVGHRHGLSFSIDHEKS
jgi:hypothetical protein